MLCFHLVHTFPLFTGEKSAFASKLNNVRRVLISKFAILMTVGTQ